MSVKTATKKVDIQEVRIQLEDRLNVFKTDLDKLHNEAVGTLAELKQLKQDRADAETMIRELDRAIKDTRCKYENTLDLAGKAQAAVAATHGQIMALGQ